MNYSGRSLPGHEDRSARADQPSVQRSRLRAGTQRDVQHRRAEQRHLSARSVDERRRLQHPVAQRHVHQHHRPAAPQRRHDQRRQDLQDQVHLRHVPAQHLLRNDAHQVPHLFLYNFFLTFIRYIIVHIFIDYF